MSTGRRYWRPLNPPHTNLEQIDASPMGTHPRFGGHVRRCYRRSCMIVSCSEMKALEATAFAKGVSPEALMEEAGRQIALAVQHFFPSPGDCTASVGKGHNAGDALVALRHLAAAGWGTSVSAAFDESEWSPLTRKKFGEFGENRSRLRNSPPLVVLDGLLGLGARTKARESAIAQWRGTMRSSSSDKECPSQGSLSNPLGRQSIPKAYTYPPNQEASRQRHCQIELRKIPTPTQSLPLLSRASLSQRLSQ